MYARAVSRDNQLQDPTRGRDDRLRGRDLPRGDKKSKYTCFLKEDSTLPMMYMPDCIKCTLDLMDADVSKLKHHGDYNVAAISFSPAELAEEIMKHIPDFEISYEPDHRQAIVESWPKTINDASARREWGWKPGFDLTSMAEDMLRNLREILSED